MDPTSAIATPTAERRGLRSNIPYQAAELYLSRLQHRKALRIAAIADEDGLLMAGLGGRNELDLLALWGILDAAEQGRYQNDINAIRQGAVCVSRRFVVDEARLAVTGIVPLGACGAEIEADLKRILEQKTAA
jgi:hypothetical protein